MITGCLFLYRMRHTSSREVPEPENLWHFPWCSEPVLDLVCNSANIGHFSTYTLGASIHHINVPAHFCKFWCTFPCFGHPVPLFSAFGFDLWRLRKSLSTWERRRHCLPRHVVYGDDTFPSDFIKSIYVTYVFSTYDENMFVLILHRSDMMVFRDLFMCDRDRFTMIRYEEGNYSSTASDMSEDI